MNPSTKVTATAHNLKLVDDDGRPYTGRIKGIEIVYDEKNDVTVFLTDDQRVIVYDGGRRQYFKVVGLEADLRECLSPGAYTHAMEGLGERVVIDL